MEESGISRKSIKELKRGSYVLLDNEPCRVEEIEFSSPGKHGAAKARLIAIGIFDNQKRTFLGPADSEIEVPEVRKKRAQVVAVTDTSIQLMDTETYEIFEANTQDPELKQNLKPGQDVEVLESMGKRLISRILGEKS